MSADMKRMFIRKCKRAGMSLMEVLIACFLFILLVVLIGGAYTGSVDMFKKTDFSQKAQKSAGIILETIAREIRGAVRIEGPYISALPFYNGMIDFPIDLSTHGLWQDPLKQGGDPGNPAPGRELSPWVAFTHSASPVNQVNIFYQYVKNECAIFTYTRMFNAGVPLSPHDPVLHPEYFTLPGTPGHIDDPDADPNPLSSRDSRVIRKFSSDFQIVIENFEVWAAPDGVVLRIQLTDRAFTYDYNYVTDTAVAGGENKFFRRPIVTQSLFLAIRYYQ